jgi:phospholipase/lecithinase/hemolysin
VFAAIAFAVASGSVNALYTSISVFGDSLSDDGNALLYNLASPGLGAALGYLVPTNPAAPPYPLGATKYTNPAGKVAVEVLAARLGLPLAPSFLGGTNFATGGATTGALNLAGDAAFVPNPSPIPGVPPGTPFYPGLAGTGIRAQVALFVGALGSSGADPGALYVVWGGPNDVFVNQALGSPQDPALSVANLAAAVTNLYNVGARTILLPNMPDLGKTPVFLGGPDAAGATGLTLAFNALLAGAILNLEGTLPGLDVLPFDTFTAFNDLLSNAGTFGFTNADTPCYLLGAACDPTQFVFWDFVHPTSIVQQILGQGFFAAAVPQAVPEPPSTALIVVGILLVAWLRWRQNSVQRPDL